MTVRWKHEQGFTDLETLWLNGNRCNGDSQKSSDKLNSVEINSAVFWAPSDSSRLCPEGPTNVWNVDVCLRRTRFNAINRVHNREVSAWE